MLYSNSRGPIWAIFKNCILFALTEVMKKNLIYLRFSILIFVIHYTNADKGAVHTELTNYKSCLFYVTDTQFSNLWNNRLISWNNFVMNWNEKQTN